MRTPTEPRGQSNELVESVEWYFEYRLEYLWHDPYLDEGEWVKGASKRYSEDIPRYLGADESVEDRRSRLLDIINYEMHELMERPEFSEVKLFRRRVSVEPWERFTEL